MVGCCVELAGLEVPELIAAARAEELVLTSDAAADDLKTQD